MCATVDYTFDLFLLKFTYVADIFNTAMRVLLTCTAFFLSLSLACRDPGFSINCPVWVSKCHHNNSLVISRALSPSFESIPLLFLSVNTKTRPPPRVQPSAGVFLLLLLAGDDGSILALGCVASVCIWSMLAPCGTKPLPYLISSPVIVSTSWASQIPGWKTREMSADLAEMTPRGFSFFQKPRAQR